MSVGDTAVFLLSQAFLDLLSDPGHLWFGKKLFELGVYLKIRVIGVCVPVDVVTQVDIITRRKRLCRLELKQCIFFSLRNILSRKVKHVLCCVSATCPHNDCYNNPCRETLY